MLKVVLKKGREKPVLMGHPWIFAGAIKRIDGYTEPGEICQIITEKEDVLGYGYCNRKSTITVRVISHGEMAFNIYDLKKRICRAIDYRTAILSPESNSCRLINSEGDFLPGLIVDLYVNGLVVQILTAGMELWRKEIIDALKQKLSPSFIYERSDTDSRKREGLTDGQGLLYGKIPESLVFVENNHRFIVDIASGQKTGYFFDQRENRKLLTRYAEGRTMCDCFSYSGAFTVNALSAGVKSVDVVDKSRSAIAWAQKNVDLNNFEQKNVSFTNADVFRYLRENDRKYDLFVLDPPKFARHPGEVERASRGYKDINLSAFKKLQPGGVLFTFSCSNAIDVKLFRQIVFAAAADAGRDIQLLHVMAAGADHPINIAHKEGDYLKGLVLRVF